MEIINTADVINWCKGIPHLEKSKRDLYLYLGDKERRLFTVPQYGEEEKGGNTIKIGLYPEFFDKWADALCLVEDSPEAIRGRLERARQEYAEADFYDYILVNDDLEEAGRQFEAILTAEHLRAKDRMELLRTED
jgi:hypothetical protein